jgi:uncharacterized membrane protein
MTIYATVQVIAVMLAGLAAGLFYSFDCSIVSGLGKLPDAQYLSAFQSINRVILNPFFFMSFIGSLLILPIAAWLTYKTGNTGSFYFMLAAAMIYAVGVFGITVGGNVPLNDELDKFDIANASVDALQQMRLKFEEKWNFLQHIRTYAAILAFTAAVISLIKKP